MTVRAYLALGSNLGDRWEALRQVLRALDEAGTRHRVSGVPAVRVQRCSSVYETAPVGAGGAVLADQPAFLNAVVELDAAISASELRWLTAGIEVALGRRDGPRNAPRPVDIDILLFGDEQIDLPGLVVPHLRMWQRSFVMVPLCELCPERGPAVADPDVRRVGALTP